MCANRARVLAWTNALLLVVLVLLLLLLLLL